MDELRWFLATNGIRTEPQPAEPYPYYTPYIGPLVIPEIIIELVRQTYPAVLTVLLNVLVQRWLSLPRLSVSIRDQSGAVRKFEGTARQVKAQIESTLGWVQCANCQSFVPPRNFCDVCGRSLFY